MFMRLLSRCAATVSAAVVAATAGLAVASPAFADDVRLTSASISASTFVINGDAGCSTRATVTAKVYDDSSDTNELISVATDVTFNPTGAFADFKELSFSSSSGDTQTFTGKIELCGFHDPGKYTARVYAYWYQEGNPEPQVTERNLALTIKRPSTLTYNASPEPVKRGKSLTHSGQLKRDAKGPGAMYGPQGVTVKFYFRAYSWSNYIYKGSVKTGANGKYSKKIAAWDSGWWKAVYEAEYWRQSVTTWDEVKVNR